MAKMAITPQHILKATNQGKILCVGPQVAALRVHH